MNRFKQLNGNVDFPDPTLLSLYPGFLGWSLERIQVLQLPFYQYILDLLPQLTRIAFVHRFCWLNSQLNLFLSSWEAPHICSHLLPTSRHMWWFSAVRGQVEKALEDKQALSSSWQRLLAFPSCQLFPLHGRSVLSLYYCNYNIYQVILSITVHAAVSASRSLVLKPFFFCNFSSFVSGYNLVLLLFLSFFFFFL